MNPKPLDGIQVVELGMTEAEGVATLLLSDYGARVTRLLSPECANEFRICDRGKERKIYDANCREDREYVRKLLAQADAVVTSLPDCEMTQIGLDPQLLCQNNEKLVYTSITPYGQKGPYAERKSDEAGIQAESGLVSITGLLHGEPVRCGGDFAHFSGGVMACIGTLMALLDAGRNKNGRRLDISMMDTMLFGLENQFSVFLKSGNVPVPVGNHYALSAPVGDYLCKDGKKLMISVATEMQWKHFSEAVGHPEWLEREEYRNVSQRIINREQLEKEVAQTFLAYDSEELIHMLQERTCIYGRINHFDEVVHHPQSAARHMFMEIQKPDGSRMNIPANPLLRDQLPEEKKILHDAN